MARIKHLQTELCFYQISCGQNGTSHWCDSHSVRGFALASFAA